MQYATLGIPPAHIKGSHTAFGAQRAEVSARLAESMRGVPKASPKFTSAEPSPEMRQKKSPFPIDRLTVGPPPKAASRLRPATAQMPIPISIRAIPAKTAAPPAVKI